MRHSFFCLVGAFLAFPCLDTPSFAEAIRCTTFLHNRDGSWRSFNEADVDGPDGIIHLKEGELLRTGDRSAKGDLARALDDMCGH